MRFFDENRRRHQQTAIKFTANNPETTLISRAHPIDRIECRLAGTLTIGTAAATALKPLGGLGLIKRLNLSLDGKDVVFSLPGHMLQQVSNLYTPREALTTEPGLTVAAHSFEYHWTLPINMGPGEFTLLDPSQRAQIVLEAQWGQASDMVTPDATTTLTLSNVQLDCWTIANAGGVEGQVGGIRADYPLHIIDYREIPVAQAQADMVQELLRDHLYSRLVLKTISDGVAVNTILNSARVNIDQSTLQTVKARQLQLEARCRYNHAAVPAGLYVLDLMDDLAGRSGKLSHLLGVASTLPFNVVLDVAKPGTTDTIIMVSDRIARPTVTQAVR
jgi:hypothetical protein